jgi:hypothetical protein
VIPFGDRYLSACGVTCRKCKKGTGHVRDCFLKTFWDTDITDFTEFRGKAVIKNALFRVFREIRVQKRPQQRLKKPSLSATTYLRFAVYENDVDPLS